MLTETPTYFDYIFLGVVVVLYGLSQFLLWCYNKKINKERQQLTSAMTDIGNDIDEMIKSVDELKTEIDQIIKEIDETNNNKGD